MGLFKNKIKKVKVWDKEEVKSKKDTFIKE